MKRKQANPYAGIPANEREHVRALVSPVIVQDLTPLTVPKHPPVPAVSREGTRGRRERATELQKRVRAFSAIYNAAYLVRNSYFGDDQRRRDHVMELIAVMLQELRATQDYEACVFALADALYASPLGVPWEP